jgi:hypothetical protein
MHSRRGTPPRSAPAIVALLVYALVLLGGPLFHTDAFCFGQSRTHCAICVANHSIPLTEDPGLPTLRATLECGALGPVEPVLSQLFLTADVTGRSPPA